MSLDVSGLAAYTDQEAMALIVKSVAGGRLSQYANLQPNVKTTTQVNILQTDVVFQADGCSRSASGTTTLSQRSIVPGAVAIHEDLSKKRHDIIRPNEKSTNILAYKFREDFVQVVQESASYKGEKYIDLNTNLPLSLASHEYNYIMTSLGFAKENRVIIQPNVRCGKKAVDAVLAAW